RRLRGRAADAGRDDRLNVPKARGWPAQECRLWHARRRCHDDRARFLIQRDDRPRRECGDRAQDHEYPRNEDAHADPPGRHYAKVIRDYAEALMKIQFAVPMLLAGVVTAAAQPLTPEQTLNRRAISDLEFSADGTRLVFTVADAPKGSTRPRHLWLLDATSGRVRPLTTADDKSDGSPKWSPDGRFIAFFRSDDGERQ